LNALHAHAALLHNPTASHRNVWIQDHPHETVLRWVEVGKLLITRIVEPIESSNLVRTVVGTVSRADATVVGHLVQAFIAVSGRRYGAYRLAWSMIAVLAHHWHVHRLWIGRWIFHLTVRTDDTGEPMTLVPSSSPRSRL